ncbi:phosphoglucomutase (alpha-D-glucose-1,6-bisphosphate-dependent) [bacterium]|nr:phosphoglucomutase (alpha-D-glucose-1,6-bisphosphate-dependent) [bacterium]MBP9808529.1 phosphoglucomutase (alpha-D-glucose-1,6-bisphosphate-dependent) [bacterium]
MSTHPLAGKPAPAEVLIDVKKLEKAYFENKPDFAEPAQRVIFGTSGHRGTSTNGTFTEAHILAITQAVCDYRKAQGTDGPVLFGKDTHALSGLVQATALEVLAANDMEVLIAANDGITAVPVISRAVLNYNRGRTEHLADALISTPSHNPPADGGFKYNPPNGGPADTDVTTWIQNRANDLLKNENKEVKRVTYETAIKAKTTHTADFITPYVRDLAQVIDMPAIATAKLKLGVDPLGGASVVLWEPINAMYNIDIEIVNKKIDPQFAFMPLDHDGKIRMDCSSKFAMANLVKLKDQFQVAFGNDPDADRHGIVTPSAGLMDPNHYLAVAINYLLTHRPDWPINAAVGKTLVSSSMIDRVVKDLQRVLCEVPVGFKWFSAGLFASTFCFGGEESAGATFLQKDGAPWTTDKDGPAMALLAAEMLAITGKDPGVHYQELTAKFGTSYYKRVDAPSSMEEKAVLLKLSPDAVHATELAGEKIEAKLTKAPGNDAAIGGLKVVTANGWFAARPSGTENIYKIYAESLKDANHLNTIIKEAQEIVSATLAGEKCCP